MLSATPWLFFTRKAAICGPDHKAAKCLHLLHFWGRAIPYSKIELTTAEKTSAASHSLVIVMIICLLNVFVLWAIEQKN